MGKRYQCPTCHVCQSCLEKRAKKRKRNLEPQKWASLPNDLLASIFDKSVFTLPDYIRFSGVCKSWKSFALSREEKLVQLTNHQLPFLMISFWNSEGHERQRSLYSFTDHRISNFNLRILNKYKHNKCYGSSHGWLIFLKSRMNRSVLFVVLNPFSGAVIRLPPMENNTSTTSYNKDAIDKVILSRDPSLGSFEVLANFSFSLTGEVVAHLKYGDKFWTYSKSFMIGRSYNSFTFYKDRILCGSQGRILSLNVVDSLKKFSPTIKIIQEVAPPVSDIERYSSRSFIVESTKGDLLMIYRSYCEKKKSTTYNIFKAVDSNGKLDCIPLMNLDGHSVFLDDNQSISVLASNYRGCRPNSIYYLYYAGVEYWSDVYKIEEFNLEDQSVSSVEVDQRFALHLESDFEYYSWILPSMKLHV